MESKISEDLEIWSNLKSGKIHGLESLYEKYVQELFRFGMSICHEEVLVQDAIQELFLEIWQYRENLSTPQNCKFYLLRSLSNKIKRDLGKEKHLFLEDLDLNQMESNLLQPQKDPISEEDLFYLKKEKLDQAFEKLSTKQRKAIHLLFFENYSYQETADILEINLKSTYTLAWKALKKLRKILLTFIYITIEWFIFL